MLRPASYNLVSVAQLVLKIGYFVEHPFLLLAEQILHSLHLGQSLIPVLFCLRNLNGQLLNQILLVTHQQQ